MEAIEQSSFQNQQQNIPISFVQPQPTITPMNAMEQSIVGNIKTKRRREVSSQDCRICLENSQDQSRMIIPCKCTGSIQCAHQHCMIEWIKRRLEMQPKKRPTCQVCSTQFKYRQSNRRHFDPSVLCRHCQKEKKSLICFFVVYGFFFLFFFVLIALTAQGKQNEKFFLANFVSQSSGMTVMISVIVIYLLAMIVVTVMFVSEYLVRQDVVITKVMSYTEPKRVKNLRIYFKQ